jgi:5-methylcytosine-specific restriction protein A
MSRIKFPNDAEIGQVFSWTEVSEVHRVRNGIYHRNGVLISLLTDFGRINPCYPDFHGNTADVIHYTGSGRRGDQKLDRANQTLLDAITSRLEVPLFNKLAPGKWEFMGFWSVIDGQYVFDEKQNRMLWKFTLSKVIRDEGD